MKIKRELSTDPVYTIGVASAKLGIPVYSLRQYEQEGLIISFKTPSGRRLYSDLEIEKIKCIKRMVREEGLNFEGIRRLIGLVPCWKLRKCAKESKGTCPAFNNITRPCWATEERCSHPFPSCRDCPVYQGVVDCSDLKDLLFESK
jgi:MerR family transcriptional regulator/heat shock protein HspR